MAQINKPSDYFNTKLYTGNGTAIGSGGNAITGVGFQPDFVWIKARNQAYNHHVYDVIRGVQQRLITNGTFAEATLSESLESFDSDGFTLGNQTAHNESGTTYASWNWLAGGTASSNTDGSITSSVSANTTAGFSIVSYTGTGANATVGHGLGAKPSMIIIKCRNNAQNWRTYHTGVADNGSSTLALDNTAAAYASSTYFQDTAPTTSVFSIGTSGDTNRSSSPMIAYCFAEKKGFSKFGTYTGNGSTDGTFVYTGFKPAFVIVKRSSNTDPWYMTDNKRDPFNVTSKLLLANASDTEYTARTDFDFLSNGFKNRASFTGSNASGDTYIYMAFAENPLVGTNNIPATAR